MPARKFMVGRSARERSLDHPAQYQRGVYSAEAEGVREHVLYALLPPGARQKIKIAGFVRNLKVDSRRQPFLLQSKRADGCLDRAGGTECVAVVPLRPAHRNLV